MRERLASPPNAGYASMQKTAEPAPAAAPQEQKKREEAAAETAATQIIYARDPPTYDGDHGKDRSIY